jgi:hypothetical protein
MPLANCLEPVCAPESEWFPHSNLISLYELMYELDVAEVASTIASLQMSMALAHKHDERFPGGKTPEGAVSGILDCLKKVQAQQDKLELDGSLRAQLKTLIGSVEDGFADLRANAIKVSLVTLIGCLLSNLQNRFFLFVPNKKFWFYNSVQLFGIASLTFIDAVHDMRDAETCYALDMPTACVFHSMRVSEHGLRALARKLRVSLTDKRKPCPIEFADWNKVLTGIDGKITKIRQLPSGAKKNNQLIFFSDAASHCTHIRDIWRNEISHTRTRYNDAEALAAMSRVADFMKLLAEKLYTDEQRMMVFADPQTKVLSSGIRTFLEGIQRTVRDK